MKPGNWWEFWKTVVQFSK